MFIKLSQKLFWITFKFKLFSISVTIMCQNQFRLQQCWKLHAEAKCVRQLADVKTLSCLGGKIHTENHGCRTCRVADVIGRILVT